MEYYYFNCPAPYATASSTCQAMGGFLTSWTSAAEQADVEGYFISKVLCGMALVSGWLLAVRLDGRWHCSSPRTSA
jgi:hypothetical protein